MKNNRKWEIDATKRVAEIMCASARTAPKAKGIDNIETLILSEEQKELIIAEMKRIAIEEKVGTMKKTFLRDANNLEESHQVVIIGTRLKTIGIPYCGYCGFHDCKACKDAEGVCFFNSNDLGIAVGSAVSIAGLNHIDNRIMYTVGRAIINLKLLGEDVKLALGIPLSVTGKNPFFDRG